MHDDVTFRCVFFFGRKSRELFLFLGKIRNKCRLTYLQAKSQECALPCRYPYRLRPRAPHLPTPFFPLPGAAPQGSLCIVTELLSRGSLEDVIRQGGLRTASYGLILNLALQVRQFVRRFRVCFCCG